MAAVSVEPATPPSPQRGYRGRRPRTWILATVAALLIAAIVATAITLSQRDDVALVGREEVERILEGIPQEDLRLGRPGAPVTVTVLGDVGCPPCQEQTRDVLAPLIQGPVEAGEVKLVYRHWNVLGPDTARGAKAALAAALQDRYWNYLLLLLLNQDVRTEWTELELVLPAIAREAGLDMEAWRRAIPPDWERPVFDEHLDESARLADLAGIPTPPGFIVNGPRGEVALTGDQLVGGLGRALTSVRTGETFTPEDSAGVPGELNPPQPLPDRGEDPDQYAGRD